MPIISLIEDFDWYPPEYRGRWCKAYKAGWSGLVTTPCAVAAIAAGKAHKLGPTEESRSGVAETGSDTAGSEKRRKAGSRTKR